MQAVFTWVVTYVGGVDVYRRQSASRIYATSISVHQCIRLCTSTGTITHGLALHLHSCQPLTCRVTPPARLYDVGFASMFVSEAEALATLAAIVPGRAAMVPRLKVFSLPRPLPLRVRVLRHVERGAPRPP